MTPLMSTGYEEGWQLTSRCYTTYRPSSKRALLRSPQRHWRFVVNTYQKSLSLVERKEQLGRCVLSSGRSSELSKSRTHRYKSSELRALKHSLSMAVSSSSDLRANRSV